MPRLDKEYWGYQSYNSMNRPFIRDVSEYEDVVINSEITYRDLKDIATIAILISSDVDISMNTKLDDIDDIKFLDTKVLIKNFIDILITYKQAGLITPIIPDNDNHYDVVQVVFSDSEEKQRKEFKIFNSTIEYISNGGLCGNSLNRSRPYSGQPHTDNGIRGAQLIDGLSVRDLCDCFIQSILHFKQSDNKHKTEYYTFNIYSTFDVKSKKEYDEASEETLEFWSKIHTGLWSYSDLQELSILDLNLTASISFVGCYAEMYSGLFPNLKLEGILSAEQMIEKWNANKSIIT